MLQVWHREATGQEKLLGIASIDLSPLVYGLAFISGWYNIVDSVGNCRGQIKLNFLPKEDLTRLRDQITERRKFGSNQGDHSKRTFSSRFNSVGLLPTPVRSRNNSTSHPAEPTKTTINVTDVKQELAKNLNELDQFNRMFKERLSQNVPAGQLLVDFVRSQAEKCIKKTEVILSDATSTPVQDPEEGVAKPPVVEEVAEPPVVNKVAKSPVTRKSLVKFDPVVAFSQETSPGENNQSTTETSRVEENIQEEVEEPVVINDTDLILNANNNNNNTIDGTVEVYDSFWVSSVRIGVSEKSLEVSDNGEPAADKPESIVEYLPPICNELVKVVGKDTDLPKDPNDTDFDQTFNLNASYEIVPSAGGSRSFRGSQVMESLEVVGDFVERIIDCSKLETEDDDEIERFLSDEKMCDETVEDGLVNYELDFEGEEADFDDDNNANRENLTVIVPEQLNKIENLEVEVVKL